MPIPRAAQVPLALLILPLAASAASPDVPVPAIAGPWRAIATDPDLGPLTSPKQQPVDFGIWQAADTTWQLWSCVRATKEPGKTRLFYRWEAKDLLDSPWKPLGIAMHADEKLGETPGGLQAPFVTRLPDDSFLMFYGDWEHICTATSPPADGKTFTRRLLTDGKPALFTEGQGANTRDPMALKIGDTWHCYYTAYPQRKGAVYCRTSKDLLHWSNSTMVAFGGEAGTGPSSAECPFVVEPPDMPGHYYLFRTQRYGENAISRVYHSTDPMKFGVNDDGKYLVTSLPVAAPEILRHNGKDYIAALMPSLKGIQIAELQWKPRQAPEK